jgi:eukaryotic-like serine/threonine-protein kinase
MAPTLVSHYRVLDQLGEGGMGVVYRAEDVRLGREVALKLLRADTVPSREWLARFEREARLASSLQHPHICTIHELGEHEGQPFLAMERLEGRTIRQLIDGPMPPARVIALARQAADALDAAHRRGIIHRDIKPANLFVTYGDHLKVLDFGLAKLASAEEAGSETGMSHAAPTVGGADLTRTGDRIGTASYMSPEQALGRTLDARTDLFSLGSVMYEMATGRRAFGGDDIALVVTKIVNGIVIPPSTVHAGVPPALEAIIVRLLAVDPADRYQSAAELMADLAEAAAALDPAEPAQVTAVAAKRRPRLGIAAALALGAVALAGVARLTVLTPRAALSDRDSLLVTGFENTTGDTVFDETLLTALKVQLGQSPFLDIVPDNRIREALRMMERPVDEAMTTAVTREICERLDVRAMLEGSIAPLGSHYVLTLNATECVSGEPLARAQAEATSSERVLQVLGSMSSSMRKTLGESLPSLERFDVPIEQATTPSLAALKAYTLGLEERRRGRELESVAFLNQAIDLDPGFAAAHATLSTVYGSLGEWRRSEEFARKAYDSRGRVSERERLFITYQFHDRVTGDQDQAAATLELWKAQYPRDARPSNALALIHNRLGRYEDAVAEAQQALEYSEHPFPLSNLAAAYRALGRYDEARAVGERAVALGIATAPTRRLLFQLGVLAGDGSAEAHLAWARERSREFDLVSAQAEVAAYEGRMVEAIELYRRAAEMAMSRRLRGTASGYGARLALTAALYRSGAPDVPALVRRAATMVEAASEGPGAVPRFRAAVAYALAGLTAEAQAIVTAAERQYPESTQVRAVLAPSTRAAIAVQQGRGQAALDALEAAARTEIGAMAGLVPVYLRAEALMLTGAFDEAAREYERILAHRGVDPFAPMVSLAHLGIARAKARAGETAASRAAYEALFEVWALADADLPALAAARAEHARLLTASGS